MKVIKKLGYRQPFEILKVKIALQRTAKNVDSKFTASDWKELKPRILSRLEPIMKGKEEIYFWEIDDVIIETLLRSRFNDITREYIQSKSTTIKDNLNDLGLSPHAMFILKERYLKKDINGEPIETAKEMMCRVASAIASIEKNGVKEKYTELFTKMLVNRDFLPNSPCLVAAGTKRKGTYAACFAYSIEDSLDDIMNIVHLTAKTFQLGGGVGISIAKLRERGSPIETTNGYSSGSVEFLNLFDVMCSTIKTGGFRRGALMCLTEYNHPDIEWFIHCKKDTSKLNNMNISVMVNDDFIDGIKNDEDINLISPKSGKVVDKISANLLLEHIATNIWETGEPGILFYNRINKDNPTPHLGDIRVCNPCLPKDAWVFSSDGPRQVSDLIDMGTKFRTKLMMDGRLYNSNGFHPTGHKDVYEIITNRGYRLKASDNHLIYTYDIYDKYEKVERWKPVSELQEGDIIRLSKNRVITDWTGRGLYWQGYLLGQLVSDGYIDNKMGHIKLWETDNGYEGVKDYINSIKHNLKTRSDFNGFNKYKETYNLKCKHIKDMALEFGITLNKELTPDMEKTSSMFYQGFICGMFDGDGTVSGTQKKGVSIRLSQNNLPRLEVIQRMLHRFGIASKIYKKRRDGGEYSMPDGHGGYKLYMRKPLHELIISKDNLSLFNTFIGFKNTNKSDKLKGLLGDYKRNLNQDYFIDNVESIEYIGMKEVFDTNVDEVHSFDANGFIVHNCAESTLISGECCNLGSINLINHMTEDTKDLDWDKFAETIKLSIRFLDNMIDASPYPSKAVEKAVKATRKVGLGVMGFADMLIHMGIRYSSKEGVDMVGKVISFLTDVASQESKSLGEEKGLYNEYKDGYRKRRNSIVTIQAPTGTLSLIAGVSPGIEPNFFSEYSRMIDNKVIHVTHPLANREVFETAHEIEPIQHLLMLAEVQKYIENSCSKTINAPEETTVSEIKELIMKAHELECKGITIFRNNCRREPLITCTECQI